MKTWIKERVRQRRALRIKRLTQRIDQLTLAINRLPYDADEDRARLTNERLDKFWRRNDLLLRQSDNKE